MMRSFARSVLINTPLERPARAALRVVRAMRLESPDDSIPVAVQTFKPIVLPDGVSEDELRETMQSISIDGSPRGALDAYVADSFHRFVHTWSMVRNESGRCLELGANPYFTTFLLHEHSNLELTYANYFGGEEGTGRQVVTFEAGGNTKIIECEFDHFNMEES